MIVADNLCLSISGGALVYLLRFRQTFFYQLAFKVKFLGCLSLTGTFPQLRYRLHAFVVQKGLLFLNLLVVVLIVLQNFLLLSHAILGVLPI